MAKAKDLMKDNLISVKQDTQLKNVAEILSNNALSGVPVVSEQGEVVGYISEKDIIVSAFPASSKFENPEVISLERLVPFIKKLSQTGAPVVKDYMNKTVCSVTEDALQGDVIDLMLDKNLKRLPVIRDNRLVGVIERSTISELSQEGNGR